MEDGDDPVVLPFFVVHRVRGCRVALGDVCSKLESQMVRNPNLPPAYQDILRKGFLALSMLDEIGKMGPPDSTDTP